MIAAALATWRLTRLVVIEPGPFDVFGRGRAAVGASLVYGQDNATSPPRSIVRKRSGLRGEVAFALECPWCASVWVAAVVLVLQRWARPLVDVLALSAVSCLADDVVAAIASSDGESDNKDLAGAG